MRNLKISFYYHPTTVFILDDNKDYIFEIRSLLCDSHLCKAYDDPRKALSYAEKVYDKTSILSRCTKKIEESAPQKITSYIDLNEIPKEVCRDDRFSKNAVAILDYNMPAMTGTEFGAKLRNLGIYRLLLTGKADQETVLRAFNSQEIDYYLSKGDSSVHTKLLEAISQLEKRCFLEESKIFLRRIPSDKLNSLCDDMVAETFYKICEENKIVEYYLLTDTGSFFLLDKDGNPSYFILLSEADLHGFYSHAEVEGANPSTIKALKSCEVIPYFHSEKEKNETHPLQWDKYLHPAKKIEGKQNYYFALITNELRYPSGVENILSYSKYMDNL